MAHIIKIGPVEAENGDHGYFAVNEDQVLTGTFAFSDAEAQAVLAAELPGEPLERMDPEPPWAAYPRVGISIGLGLNTMGDGLGDIGALHGFAECVADFYKTRAFAVGDRFRVAFSGAFERTMHGEIMGMGEERGFVLFSDARRREREEMLVQLDLPKEGVLLADFAVLLARDPPYAVAAVREAYGIGYLPTPMRLANGAAVAVTPAELVALGACASALSVMGKGDSGEGFLESDLRVDARVVREPPSRPPEPPVSAG